MRRLSGWARLWIVLAVIVWTAGGWWISTNPQPRPLGGNFSADACVPPEFRGTNLFPAECGESQSTHCDNLQRQMNACLDAAEANGQIAADRAASDAGRQRYDLEVLVRWTGVALAPLVLALGFFWVRAVFLWIHRGFRPPPAV